MELRDFSSSLSELYLLLFVLQLSSCATELLWRHFRDFQCHRKDQTPPQGLWQLLYWIWQTWPQRCVLGGHGELVSVCPSGHLKPPLLFPSFRPFWFSLAGGHWMGQNYNFCLLEIYSSSSGLLVTLCVQDAAVASLHQSAFRIALPCGVEFLHNCIIFS